MQAVFRYTIPDKYGDAETDCEFEDGRFYLPTSGWPMFGLKPLKGTVSRVRYEMVDANGDARPPCTLDFPKRHPGNLYKVGHCPNLVRRATGARGRIRASKLCVAERGDVRHDSVGVERVGRLGGQRQGHVRGAGHGRADRDRRLCRHPRRGAKPEPANRARGVSLTAHSFQDEPKAFEVRLENAGKRTCVTVHWDDGLPTEFYGSLASCRTRYPELGEADVRPFNYTEKVIRAVRNYSARGVYHANATAFDIRHYSKAALPVTIFRSPCQAPRIWIPLNYTDIEKPELIPTRLRSAAFEIQSVPSLNCEESVIT